MLRDGLSSLDRHNDEHLFMSTAGVSSESPHGQVDALDDVFGSAPGSPVVIADDHENVNEPRHSTSQYHSDIPGLRRLHVTNGYREGIAASKEQYIQEGFDEGYSLGAEIGMKAGWCLGALHGLVAIAGGDIKREMAVLLHSAEEELQVKNLFNSDHFGADGIWLYDVPGQDTIEDQVTFERVAANHPVLLKWMQRVKNNAGSLDLQLEFQ